MSASEFVRIMPLTELAEGKIELVQVDGNDVLLTKIEGEVYAVRNICTHGGAPLSMGKLNECTVQCPGHGSVYDLKTGRGSYPSRRRLITYEVKFEGNWVLLGRVPIERIFPFTKS
ncbi:MAG: Rieske (2Fe-2S) protein [Nitrososphaerales archaeon]